MPRAELHLKAVFPEIWYLDGEPWNTPLRLEIENWIVEDVWTHSLLNNVRVFTIDVDHHVSPTLLSSLTNTQRLVLRFADYMPLSPAFDLAIRSMVSLRELEINTMVLSRIPNGLTGLSVGYIPVSETLSVDFWKAMQGITNLVDLQLEFERPRLMYPGATAICSCIDNTLRTFNRLRSFDQTGRVFNVTNFLAQKIIENAPVLEYLQLGRMVLDDRLIDRIATRRLMHLRLSLLVSWHGNRPMFISDDKLIHWSSLSRLFVRNPRLKDVRIHFGQYYSQFEVKDIAVIAQACPHLRSIYFTFEGPFLPYCGDAERRSVDRSRIYTNSEADPEADEFMKEAIQTSYQGCDTICVDISLDLVRMFLPKNAPTHANDNEFISIGRYSPLLKIRAECSEHS
jgi:hypothetical protein